MTNGTTEPKWNIRLSGRSWDDEEAWGTEQKRGRYYLASKKVEFGRGMLYVNFRWTSTAPSNKTRKS